MTIQPFETVFELVDDNRFDEAIVLLDRFIARVEPNARLYALRAVLLVATKRPTEASTASARALSLDANDAFVQRAAAEVALALGEPAQAIVAAQRSRALDPDDDSAVFLEARARALLGQWDSIVAQMDGVLLHDPSNEQAAVMRALAVEAKQKGRERFGASDWEDLARRFPINSLARSGHAWKLLSTGKASAAREEFQQALAVDPTSAWAKQGMVLALKARYPGYGVLLRFFFWLHTLPTRTRNLLAVGGVLGVNVLRQQSSRNPGLKVAIMPILVAYGVFVLATWLADPLLSLVLMRHPEGRSVLSADDRAGGLRVGACLGGAVVLALVGLMTPLKGALVGAFVVGASSVTVAGAYNCAPGRYRRRLLTAAAVFVALGVGAAVLPGSAGLLGGVGVVGIVVGTWVSRGWARRCT